MVRTPRAEEVRLNAMTAHAARAARAMAMTAFFIITILVEQGL